jgi:hypothetical protein
MLIKTSELIDLSLDWAVAHCVNAHILKCTTGEPTTPFEFASLHAVGWNNYSSDWDQGGPIIESEPIKIDPRKWQWEATIWNAAYMQNASYGPTALIAAMRCLVSSRLGHEVDIPEILM